jgi:predicted alpha/beta hydrolase family esterase
MKALIFHGTHGTPQGNWFPWLSATLKSKGWDVTVPTLPTPDRQSLENWKKALAEQVPNFADADILIGHSCGGSFALRLLEEQLITPKQTILVGTVIDVLGNQFDELNKSFIDTPFDWQKIAKSCDDITVFHGTGDPYVATSHAKTISKELNAPLHMIDGGGHLNADAGYLEFPELLKTLHV